MAGYIFNPEMGETPASITKKRELAWRLMGNIGAPKNVGEGLSAIGNALIARQMTQEADATEKAGMASANAAMAALFGGAGGSMPSDGSPATPSTVMAPGSTVPNDDNAMPGTVGMDQRLADRSQDFIQDNPNTYLSSGVRSREDQQRLYDNRASNPNPVARPGTSNHERGMAVDIGGMTPQQRSMLPQYGLAQPVANDPPHVELAGGGGAIPGSGPGMGQSQGLSMQTLFAAASNPFLNAGQRSMVNAMLSQRLEQQDPKYQLQMQALRQSVARGSSPVNVGGGYLYDPDTKGFIKSPGADADFRKATPEEAATYGVAAGQFGPDGRFYPVNPPSGMSIESDGQGGFKLTQGPGAGRKGALTEGQSKDTVYATRAEGSLGTLDQFGNALTSPIQRAAEYDPTGMVRGQQTPQFQQAQQAGQEFLQAILRKDTGAAITSDEMSSYGKTYLPQPGDGPELLAQKQVSRRRALEALKAGMPPQAILNQELALSRSSGASAPPAAVNMLRSNPALAAQFDQKYGQGAAAKVLGAH